jgi:hypothetical protein
MASPFAPRKMTKRLFALTIAIATGCDREGAARSGPSISLATGSAGTPSIVATGTRAVRDTNLARVLIVTMKPDDSIAVAGRYRRSGDRIEFQPMFPLDPGRTYYARLVLPGALVRAELPVPGVTGAATTVVVRSTPSTDTVPENLLRMYLEFSDSMSRESGVEHIHLLDGTGKEVRHAFLPLDGDFWNPAHTRYTVFFDPGRVKRGILPNEEMGRPLRAGRTYTLVVDSTWHDAHGRPLGRSLRRTLVASPAVVAPITLAEWRVIAPKAGTRDSLIVIFPRSLDRGLIDRSIGVETDRGSRVEGAVAVARGERRWAFAPANPWAGSRHRIVVLSILEDVAGNQVNHPFEVDLFEKVDSVPAPSRYSVPFTPGR